MRLKTILFYLFLLQYVAKTLYLQLIYVFITSVAGARRMY